MSAGLRIKSMKFQCPERIPIGVGILPSAWMKYREELDAVVCRHPLLFGEQGARSRDYDALWNTTYAEGSHTDPWGCVWENIHHGQEAIVTKHPVPTRKDVRKLKAPERDSGFPHGFMYLRLGDLRGFEEIMIDFAEEPPELQMLIDTVLEYNMRQAKIRLSQIKPEDGIAVFGDDLGTQHALPISPEMWRRYLKPCYMKIYKPFKDAGLSIYMHTDGHIYEIIPDLMDCGVDVVNPQIRANGIDNLVRVCKGKVCVDLDLDRQMFPFCSPKDIDEHVRECVVKLGSKQGGLWLKGEIDDGVPLENAEALFSAMERYSRYFS